MRPVLHDNLMGAHIPHLVVEAFSPLVLITLYHKNRICCGNTSDKPIAV